VCTRSWGKRPAVCFASQAEGEEGEKKKNGPGRGKEGGEVYVFSSFKKKLFSNSFFKLQTSLKQETMHLNHDAKALVILTL
jgi:hypothetical protein